MTNDNFGSTPAVDSADWFREMVAASSSRLAQAPEASQTTWYKEHQAEKEQGASK
jgi:hypothetical protein